MSLRNIARNFVLAFFPAQWSYRINVYKNIQRSFLEPEMPFLIRLLETYPRNGKPLIAVDLGANLVDGHEVSNFFFIPDTKTYLTEQML